MVKITCCRKPMNIKLSDFWVTSHERLSDFYASSWQKGESPIPLLVLRSLGLIVALSIISWAIYEGCNWYWLLFLTNWGLMLVCAMFLSGVIVSIAATCKRIPEEGEMPWYVSMFWFLHNVAVGVSLLITLLYWVLLYNPAIKEMVGMRLFVLDVMTHGANSMLVLLEVLASRTPVQLLHFYQPLGVGLWYAAFTGIYYLAGGTDGNGLPFIYDLLDWRHGLRSSIVITISAMVLIILYCLVFAVASCREKFTGYLFRTTSMNLALVPPETNKPYAIPEPEDFV